jgi:small-conductance mechanosensitive channel
VSRADFGRVLREEIMLAQIETQAEPSAQVPIDNLLLQRISDFCTEIGRGEHWQSLITSVSTALLGNLFSTGLVLIVFLFGLMAYQRLIWFSDRIIKRANREEFISSHSALQLFASSATASIICWTPMALLGAGLFLFSSKSQSPDFQSSLGFGMIIVFFVGVGYHLLQEFFSHGGLSEALYGFKYSNSRYIVNRLEMMTYLATPLVFMIAFTRQFQNGQWYDSVGRVNFILLAGLAFSQFHNLMWPNSKLYQRLLNDEATADSRWIHHRIAIYVFGSTLFFLAIGLTLGGWLEYANSLTINFTLSVFCGLFLVAARTIFSKRAAELIRKTHLLEDLGRSTDSAATARSTRVQQLVASNSPAAFRGIDFLTIVCFAVANYWIWREWITLPTELLNLKIGGVAMSGIVIIAKLLAIGSITLYCARELPTFLMWCFSHQTRLTIGNPKLMSRLISATIAYLGLWLSIRVLNVELPVIPWLGTLLVASVLYGARNFIEDGVAGARLLVDSRVAAGDCIEVDGRFGRVAEVNWFNTIVEDNLGTRNVVPNSKIVTQTIVKSRNEEVLPLVIDVTLPRNSDAYQAHAVMMLVAQRDPAVVPEPPAHVRFLGFRLTEIRFEIRMLVLANQDLAETRHRIEQKLEVEFERHEVFGKDEINSLRFERMSPELTSGRAG